MIAGASQVHAPAPKGVQIAAAVPSGAILGDKLEGDEVLKFGSRDPGIHAGRCPVGAVI